MVTPEISKAIVVLVTIVVAAVVIVFHYEVMLRLNHWFNRRMRKGHDEIRYRPTIFVIMFTLLLAHVVEIWLFGIAFWGLLNQDVYGALKGYADAGFLDCVYFSAANYTTVGWGDVTGTGDIRFLAGTESLLGFMMITWSASYSYLIMSRTWGEEPE